MPFFSGEEFCESPDMALEGDALQYCKDFVELLIPEATPILTNELSSQAQALCYAVFDGVCEAPGTQIDSDYYWN